MRYKIVKITVVKSVFFLLLCVLFTRHTFAADNNKVLVVGVDGLINSVIDYASTPSIDELIANATYNMNSYGGSPSYSSTGWATMLTGVPSYKHGVVANNSFSGNNFGEYPSVVNRIKLKKPNIKVASIVRDSYINQKLNSEADFKFDYATDEGVLQKSVEILKQPDIALEFVQFSGAKQAGESVGFLLREAEYVLAVQKIDQHISVLIKTIKERTDYKNENWFIYLVSTHGGSASGVYTGTTINEINVPIILSANSLDNKFYDSSILDPIKGADNSLGVKKLPPDRTYIRIPIAGTALQGMDKYTIEMWVKANDDNGSDPSIMGDKNWDSGGNPGFVICRRGSSWKINFANQGRSRYDIGSNKILEDGKWHHIAISFDKTKECVCYQDGEQVAYSKLTYQPEDTMTSPYEYICLAQEGSEVYGGGAPNWSGSFNEVRIWTDVLSHEVIKDYMNLRNIEVGNHPHLSSLNLYLKMDETNGTRIEDFSGKGNHAELIGPGAYRNPYYSLKLTDISVNILNNFNITNEKGWGLDGNGLKIGVPYRLFKVNK